MACFTLFLKKGLKVESRVFSADLKPQFLRQEMSLVLRDHARTPKADESDDEKNRKDWECLRAKLKV